AFKEICPGGLGYHVTNPYIYKPKPPPAPPVNPEVYERGDTHHPMLIHPKPTTAIAPLPVPTVQKPIEAFGFTERHLPVVVEKTSPAAPVVLLPSSASQDINPTQFAAWPCGISALHTHR
ncbi:latent-transforming growth factor beta-binding protein 1 isoform X1, partial [Tachysurus ichikawai]